MIKKSRLIIDGSNLPARPPLLPTLFWWMFLDYVSAPEWLFGVFGVMMVLLWVVFIHEKITSENKDIFN